MRLRDRSLADKSSGNVWALVLCSATYTTHQPLNHWVPGWWRIQLGDVEFHRLAKAAEETLVQRCMKLNLNKRIAARFLDGAGPETRAEIEAKMQSYQDEIDKPLGSTASLLQLERI